MKKAPKRKSKVFKKQEPKHKNIFEGATHVYTTKKSIVRLDAKDTPIKDKTGRIIDYKVLGERRRYYNKNNPQVIMQAQQYWNNV